MGLFFVCVCVGGSGWLPLLPLFFSFFSFFFFVGVGGFKLELLFHTCTRRIVTSELVGHVLGFISDRLAWIICGNEH